MTTKFETPYSRAWDAFATTPEYRDAVNPTSLGAAPEQTKYLQNRLARAFAAGWNAKTSTILDVLNQRAASGGQA